MLYNPHCSCWNSVTKYIFYVDTWLFLAFPDISSLLRTWMVGWCGCVWLLVCFNILSLVCFLSLFSPWNSFQIHLLRRFWRLILCTRGSIVCGNDTMAEWIRMSSRDNAQILQDVMCWAAARIHWKKKINSLLPPQNFKINISFQILAPDSYNKNKDSWEVRIPLRGVSNVVSPRCCISPGQHGKWSGTMGVVVLKPIWKTPVWLPCVKHLKQRTC